MTAPSLPRPRPIVTVLALALLAGCTIRNTEVPHHAVIEQLPPVRERAFQPSFDCTEAASAIQDAVCGSPKLSSLDRQLAETFRRQLRQADLIGRDQLLATERHWLATRRLDCVVPPRRQQDLTPDPAIEACLAQLYKDRIAAIESFRVASKPDAVAPIAAYVAIKPADYAEPGLCQPLAELLETAIQQSGTIDPAHLPGMTELAGTHGPAEAAEPFRLSVSTYEGGPEQSYELRARALSTGAAQAPALDQSQFTTWIKAQPNHGGRFALSVSETKDFASIDVVRWQNRVLALAVEPWGYFSPAGIGESSYAGVFELGSAGQATPRCLFKTYLRPPAHSDFDALPSYAALTKLLTEMAGMPPDDLAPNDRREQVAFLQELRSDLINLPLIGTAEVRQSGWAGWLHHRQDATLDALFTWSERDLASKLLYRKLIPLMRPAEDELTKEFIDTQSLRPGEAQQAAELVLIELIEHTIGTYPGSAAVEALKPAGEINYKQRFPVAPLPSDIEAGRPIRSLHSAVLNQLPAEGLMPYLKYEENHSHSLGSGGETSLMAAVALPETTQLLLGAGAMPNEGNAWHKTPLMQAAQTDKPDSARLLLDAGANPELATIAYSALENGVQMFQINTSGRTALMYAAANAHPALIKLLLDHGAKPQDRDSNGKTACDYLRQNAGLAEADRGAAQGLLCR